MFGPPNTWMSDNATHFRNRAVSKFVKALGVEHRFSVGNSSLTHGTIERMIHQLIHGETAMLNDGRRPFTERVVVAPAIEGI